MSRKPASALPYFRMTQCGCSPFPRLTSRGPIEELSAELRPIVVKFRRVFGPIELASALSDALQAQAGRRPDRALDRAVARGLMVREAIKEQEGGHISAEEAGRVLGISKPAVLERFKKGQLPGWREPRQGSGPLSSLAICRGRSVSWIT